MTTATDSPRWCETCQKYGDHHTDRHDEMTTVRVIHHGSGACDCWACMDGGES